MNLQEKKNRGDKTIKNQGPGWKKNRALSEERKKRELVEKETKRKE
jgi:hypothetical protein